MGGPEKTDRAITGWQEEVIFCFQMARELIEQKIAAGDKSPRLRYARDNLDRVISLSERISNERDPGEIERLKTERKKIEEELDPVMESLGEDEFNERLGRDLEDEARREDRKKGW